MANLKRIFFASRRERQRENCICFEFRCFVCAPRKLACVCVVWIFIYFCQKRLDEEKKEERNFKFFVVIQNFFLQFLFERTKDFCLSRAHFFFFLPPTLSPSCFGVMWKNSEIREKGTATFFFPPQPLKKQKKNTDFESIETQSCCLWDRDSFLAKGKEGKKGWLLSPSTASP